VAVAKGDRVKNGLTVIALPAEEPAAADGATGTGEAVR
jgi:hypothetical protein